MSKSYHRRKDNTEVVVKKSGLLGKVVALLLGLVIGITAGLGGLVGAIYHIINKVPVNDAIDSIEDMTKTEIDISKVLTDEYASKTVMEIIGSIQDVSKEFQAGTGSFSTLNKISPSVRKSVEGIVEEVEKYGLALDVNELMDTPFSALGDYLTAELDAIEVGTLLDKVNVSLTGNPILMALCYGDSDNYTVTPEGEVIMKDGYHPTTIGEFKQLDNLLNDLALYSIFDSGNFDITDPLMATFAFGPASHYDIVKVDGKDKAVMKVITFTLENDKFIDVDGNEYAFEQEGEVYTATRVVDAETTIVYNVKLADGVLSAYDKDTNQLLRYQKTTVGDLLVGADPLALIAPVELGKLMNIKATDNKALLALAYGVQDKDFKIEGNEIVMIGTSKPRTIGDLLDSEELNNLFNTLPIDSLIVIDKSNELLLALAYGAKSHYTIDGNTVTMNDITFTKEGDSFTDVDGNVYTGVANGELYTISRQDGEETITYTVKYIDTVWTAIDKDGNAITYSKTTLSSLQQNPMSILNGIELGAAMNLTPEHNKILLTLAYGIEGEDYDLVDSNNDGDLKDTEDIVMRPGKKPMTIGSIQDQEWLNNKINTIPLESLFEVDLSDALLCALAYGNSSHYTIDGNTVTMNDITFTKEDDSFTDVDGNVYTGVANGELYTISRQDGKETITYTVKYIDTVWTAIDKDGNAIKYSKTTISSLQKDPMGILNGIALTDLVDINPSTNSILILLAYGIENEDYYLEDGNGDGDTNDKEDKIVLYPGKQPTTLGSIQDTNWITDKMDNIPLDALFEVDLNDALLCALAYGNSSHYTIDGNTVTMNDITFTKDGDSFTDVDGNVYTGVANGELYTISRQDGEETITYTVKLIDTVWTAIDEDGKAITYSKTTISSLQKDPMAILNDVKLCDIIDVTPADSILLTLAYGIEDVDYRLEDGNGDGDTNDKEDTIVVLTAPATLGDIQDKEWLDDKMNNIPLDALIEVDLSDALLCALAYGNSSHYTIDGNTVIMNQIVFTKNSEGNFVDVDGKEYVATPDGKWEHTPQDANEKPIVYSIKEIEGKWYAYDTETGNILSYEKTTISSLQEDPMGILNDVKLCDIIDVTPADSILLTLAYGIEGVDYELKDGNGDGDTDDKEDIIVVLTAPATLGDIQDKEWLDDKMNNIPLDSLIEVDLSDALLCALAYGASSHYTINGNTVTMNDITFTKDGDSFTDVDGNVYTGVANGELYTVSREGEEYTVKYINNVWTAIDEDGNVIKYSKTTLSSLQKDPMAILNTVKLADVMEVTPADSLLLVLAYGIEGVDYELKDGNGDGDTDDKEDISVLTKAATLGDIQNKDWLDDKMNNIPLDALIEVDLSDALLCALAYGNSSHYTIDGNTVTMNDITFTKEGDSFTDVDGNVYTGVANGELYTISRQDGEETITYTVKYIDTVWTAIDEDGKAITYSKTTLSSLQEDPMAILNTVKLADVMEVTPADSLLLVLAYGIEGVDYELKDGNGDGDTDDKEDISVLTKAATLGDIQNKDWLDDKMNNLPLDALIEVDLSDALLCALAYGNSSHYTIDGNTVIMNQIVFTKNSKGNFVDVDGKEYVATLDGRWVHTPQDADEEPIVYSIKEIEGKWYAYDTETGNTLSYEKTTISSLQDNPKSLINNITLGDVLNLNPTSNAIMLELAYGVEGEHYTFVDVDNNDKIDENDKIQMKEGYTPKTIKDLQDPEATMLKEIRLATVLDVSLEKNDDGSFKDDPFKIAIAYGNEGEHFEINADGSIKWLPKDPSNPDGEKYSYRTIAELENDTDLFKTMHLGTALNITASSNPILIEIAYGTDYTIDGNKVISDNPRTLKSLEGEEGNKLFDSLRLGTALKITPSSSPILIELAYGVEGEDYNVVGDKIVPITEPLTLGELQGSEAMKLFEDIRLGTALDLKPGDSAILLELAYGIEKEDYNIVDGKIVPITEPLTLGSLQSSGNPFEKLRLSTALNIKPNANPIMLAIAYGKEYVDFEIIDANENGKRDENDQIKMIGNSKPRTIADLQDADATLIKDIELLTIMTPNYDDKLIMYVMYGGAEGAHYEFRYEDATDPAKKTGVRMLEQRIAILNVDGKTLVYNEYNEELKQHQDYSQLTQNDDGSYTYTVIGPAVTDENGMSTAPEIMYTAKPHEIEVEGVMTNETVTVDYLNSEGDLVEGEATVYWLYNTNGDLLHYTPNTIGAMQDSQTLSSIVDHLSIRDLVGGTHESKLFETVGDWRINDLKKEEKIMSLQLGEVIDTSNATGILKAMETWTLSDLTKPQKVEELKINEILEIEDGSPKILVHMRDNNWTLGDLNSDRLDKLKLGEVITLDENDTVLKHLKDTELSALASKITTLTITELFQNKIFAKIHEDKTVNNSEVTVDENQPKRYTLFVDTNNNNEVDSGEIITDKALIEKYKNDGYETEILEETDNHIVGYLYTNYLNNNKADDGEYLIGKHIWWYLLHNDAECDTNHADLANRDEQCYHAYKLNELDVLIDNMKTNVENATLYQLQADGLINFSPTILDDPIKAEVGNIPVQFLAGEADTLGDLTVAQLVTYVNLLVIALNLYEQATGFGN